MPIVTLVDRDTTKYALVPTGPDVGHWGNIRGFDDSGWIEVEGYPGGVGYERNAGYETHLGVNLDRSMYGVNGSCLIRIPFSFSGDRSELGQMTLAMQYDDGFVAYLNGAEIARRNFTGEPTWNATAQSSHNDADAVVFEAIDVSDSLDALRDGANVLAIHGLNVSTTSSDFLINARLTASREPAIVTPEGANVYTTPIPLTQSVRVKARVRDGNIWSALNEATFAVGPVAESLRISEIMYHPADLGGADDPNVEYIELTNVGPVAINLRLVEFTNGVSFTFPDLELAPQTHTLIVRDLAAFEDRYGSDLPVAGVYEGSLSNAGERLELRDAAGAVIQDLRYSDDWYDLTDGGGFSLTLRNPASGDLSVGLPQDAWRPSAMVGGSPGFDDADQAPPIGAVVINELLANSAGGVPDWVELRNTTDQPVNVGGWFLSDDEEAPTKYEIAAETIIAPYGHLVLTEDQHFGSDDDPGSYDTFGLSRDGETLFLRSGSEGALTGYSEQVTFGPSEPSVTLGRYQTSTGVVDFVALSTPTPGLENAEPRVGPIVISEIMYHPAVSEDAEYVELLNATAAAVTLYDFTQSAPWRFTDNPGAPSIDVILPADPPVTLAPWRYLVLVKDRAVFESVYTVGPDTQIIEWAEGSLDNAGEVLQLSKPGRLDDEDGRSWIAVDRIAYSDGSHGSSFPGGVDPWPTQPDGQGLSLTRIAPGEYGNDPVNWQAATDSAGASRRRPH